MKIPREGYLYIGLTLGLTGFFHGMLAMLSRLEVVALSSVLGMVLLILGGSVPTVMAFVLIHRQKDPLHRAFFYQSLTRWRMGLVEIAYALVIPILLGLLALFVRRALYGTPWLVFDLQPVILFPLFLLSGLVFGGLEEIGWRGYLQHRLLAWRAIPLALFIGVIWALWHVPLFFVVGASQADFAFLPYLLQALVFSFFLTGLYLKTGSIVLTVLFHASINASATMGLAPVFAHTLGTYVYLALAAAVGLYSLWVIEKTVHLQKGD
ncbi:MAG: CPBP family intramembrane metalloprotease [Acholeplasmatales bacterium]|nr:MAG: CPBP family intramembrane metalloprotease [Acholeplasmatales bacterium]